jgi:hypothetical protein
MHYMISYCLHFNNHNNNSNPSVKMITCSSSNNPSKAILGDKKTPIFVPKHQSIMDLFNNLYEQGKNGQLCFLCSQQLVLDSKELCDLYTASDKTYHKIENILEKYANANCGHYFHIECIIKHFIKNSVPISCPICQKSCLRLWDRFHGTLEWRKIQRNYWKDNPFINNIDYANKIEGQVLENLFNEDDGNESETAT